MFFFISSTFFFFLASRCFLRSLRRNDNRSISIIFWGDQTSDLYVLVAVHFDPDPVVFRGIFLVHSLEVTIDFSDCDCSGCLGHSEGPAYWRCSDGDWPVFADSWLAEVIVVGVICASSNGVWIVAGVGLSVYFSVAAWPHSEADPAWISMRSNC